MNKNPEQTKVFYIVLFDGWFHEIRTTEPTVQDYWDDWIDHVIEYYRTTGTERSERWPVL